METETRYQRIARQQRERQEARAQHTKKPQHRTLSNRERRRERAYTDWCISDFPNQSDN